MARKVQNKKGAHYCRSLVQSQKSAHHLLMKAKTYSSSSELHGADKIGYLSLGVVDSSHGTSNDILHVGVCIGSGDARRAGGISRNVAHEPSTVSHHYGAQASSEIS